MGMLLWGMPGRHVPCAVDRHRSITGRGELRGQGEGLGSSPMREGSTLGGRDTTWLGTTRGPCVGAGGGESSKAHISGQKRAREARHGLAGRARVALSNKWAMALWGLGMVAG